MQAAWDALTPAARDEWQHRADSLASSRQPGATGATAEETGKEGAGGGATAKGAKRMDSRGEEEGQSGCAQQVAKGVAKMAGKEQREVAQRERGRERKRERASSPIAKGVAKKAGKEHDREVAGVCAPNIKEKGANNRAADTRGSNKSVGGRGGGGGGGGGESELPREKK